MEITFETFGAVALITLNRPEQRNAVNGAMMTGLKAALARFEADSGLRAAVLTGAGPIFCAGMDLGAFVRDENVGLTEPEGFAGFVRAARTKPIVAAVNGGAFAGGLEIMLACDMALAEAGARLALPEVKRGIVAAAGGAHRLPRRIPPAIATEMLLTGEPITAERAFALGLVNAVLPGAELVPAALELAARVAANGPLAVQLTLALSRTASAQDEAALWAENAAIWQRIDASDDAREGARAFKEKRPPVWTGR